MNAAILKVHIIDIQTDTLGNTDAGAKQQGQHGQITQAGTVVEGFLFFGQSVTLFYGIQQQGHFIYIQANDFFFVKLWELDEGSRIGGKLFRTEKVIIKALKEEIFRMMPRLCS